MTNQGDIDIIRSTWKLAFLGLAVLSTAPDLGHAAHL